MAGNDAYKIKWQAEHTDRIYLIVPKGKKTEIKDYAASKGESINAFINRLINTEMQKEK